MTESRTSSANSAGDLGPLRRRLEQEKGRLGQVMGELSMAKARLSEIQAHRVKIEQAQAIIQKVAQQTQEMLSFLVNDMASMMIDAIFPDDDYSLYLEFQPRRGKTEADIFLADSHGNKIRPSDSDGGGLVNVAAFALRVALWSLSKSSRPLLVLDEPFHFLHSKVAHERIAELLHGISNRLGLQIIMITGESESEEIMESANVIFNVEKKNQLSVVKAKSTPITNPAPAPPSGAGTSERRLYEQVL